MQAFIRMREMPVLRHTRKCTDKMCFASCTICGRLLMVKLIDWKIILMTLCCAFHNDIARNCNRIVLARSDPACAIILANYA